jgi:hypothetical protein
MGKKQAEPGADSTLETLLIAPEKFERAQQRASLQALCQSMLIKSANSKGQETIVER